MDPDYTSEPAYNPIGLALVAIQALVQNGWAIVASVEQPVAQGYVQHGHAAFARTGGLDDDHIYLTAQWAIREDGSVTFDHGEYDLTRNGALASLSNRSGVTAIAVTENVTGALCG